MVNNVECRSIEIVHEPARDQWDFFQISNKYRDIACDYRGSHEQSPKTQGAPTINYRGRFYEAFLNTNQTHHRTSHRRISELRLHPFGGGLLRPPRRHALLTLLIEYSTLEFCVFSPRINPYLCTPNTTRPIRFRCYTDIVHTINLFPCVL